MLKATLSAACLLAGATVAAAQQAAFDDSPRSGLDLATVVLFSDLDGGPMDEDGFADGVLTLRRITIRGDGLIVVDGPSATFAVEQTFHMLGEAAIAPNGARDEGPTVVIRAGGDVRLERDARIDVSGALHGGVLSLCSQGDLSLLNRAEIMADAIDPTGVGGLVQLEAAGLIDMGSDELSIHANGDTGGGVSITGCGDAVLVDGTVSARGLLNGGSVTVRSRTSGVRFSPSADVDATGGSTGGAVTVRAGTQVLPDPPFTDPPAVLFEGFPSEAPCDCTVPSESFLTVDPPESPTALLTTGLSGTTTAPGTTVRVAGGASPVETVSGADRAFAVDVPLQMNKINHLVLTEIDASGASGPAVPVAVIQDLEPPSVAIDFPADGAVLNLPSVSVAGRVSDRLTGSLALSVSVNGTPAVVDAGLGTNGTFTLSGLNLDEGVQTTIVATAADALGNEGTSTVEIVYEPPTASALVAVSGDGQTAEVETELNGPIVARVMHAGGSPWEQKLVTFVVTKSDGKLTAEAGGEGGLRFQAFTDSAGEARAFWALGSDAGSGNNRVVATSVGVPGEAVFHASAMAGAPTTINVGTGANQVAVVDGPAPEPAVAFVHQGPNGVGAVPVTFRVVAGDGGILVDGSLLEQATVETSSTGYADVSIVAGSVRGNTVVEADFADNEGRPAVFRVLARAADHATTSFFGLVLDNAMQPIGGAICTLEVDGEAPIGAVTADTGEFMFDDIPFSGLADLYVDGSTALAVGGVPINPAELRFPELHFEPVVIENARNSLPMAVMLPGLNPANDVLYDGSQDITLTTEGLEGLSIFIVAGSMTLPDGTTPTPSTPLAQPISVALNQVHAEEIPMPMPNGIMPAFALTLQPGGATFDPPARISVPNSGALRPGAMSPILSFDHDTARFEVVGTSHVTEDGSMVVSDPGSGLTKAGWHCGECPTPDSDKGAGGSSCKNRQCWKCKTGLVADNTPCDDGNACTENDKCQNGSCVGEPIGPECGGDPPSSVTYEWSNPPLQDNDGNWAAPMYEYYAATLCLDVDAKKWRYIPFTVNSVGEVHIQELSITPNPVDGGNIGGCPDANPGDNVYCFCDVVDCLERYKGPNGGRGDFHLLEASKVHEEYHRDTDFPGLLNPLWADTRTVMKNIGVSCFVPPDRAEQILKARSDKVFCQMRMAFKDEANDFVRVHNAPPYDEGAYCVAQSLLNDLILEIEIYALFSALGTCTPGPGDPDPGGMMDPYLNDLIAAASESVLPVGQGATMGVNGIYTDFTVVDLTAASTGTRYFSYEPGIAAVDENGLITAVSPGRTVIFAMHFPELPNGEDALPLQAPVEIVVLHPNDQDGDLMPDDYELEVGHDPTNPLDGEEDPDGDGLSNVDECLQSTDPFNPDTDGDGKSDGDEVSNGTDPLAYTFGESGNGFMSGGGQTVAAAIDGTFTIDNMSGPDKDGPDGEGDGFSDNFVRITGFETDGENTTYVYTDPFMIEDGEVMGVDDDDLFVSDEPPAVPVSIALSIDNQLLTAVGETTQASVIATLSDGSELEVSGAAEFTTYMSSNPAVARINLNGQIEAMSQGFAFITAMNDGASAVAQVNVAIDGIGTTVVGFVVTEDGAFVENALVEVQGQGVQAFTGPTGYFELTDVVADDMIVLNAFATINGDGFNGSSGPIEPVPDGITDAGLLGIGSLKVLILYDVQDSRTIGLRNALQDAGLQPELSNAPENEFLGGAFYLSQFAAVIHLNGETFDYGFSDDLDMPLEGQQALVDYVQNGGGFIHSEWNATEASIGDMELMGDLTLINSGFETKATASYETVPAQANHPILAGLPSVFQVQSSATIGTLKIFAEQPSTVLMVDSQGPGGAPALAIREFGAGRVIGMHHSGNAFFYDTLLDENIQQLYINSVIWANGN